MTGVNDAGRSREVIFPGNRLRDARPYNWEISFSFYNVHLVFIYAYVSFYFLFFYFSTRRYAKWVGIFTRSLFHVGAREAANLITLG